MTDYLLSQGDGRHRRHDSSTYICCRDECWLGIIQIKWFSECIRQHLCHPLIQNKMVAKLAKNANLPMPKVYEIPNEQPNAFCNWTKP